ncbi:MAG: NTP transferase domain-containing protein, partial [Muribaculaceae bacterium]|nr:NTP transferase domain-containing protein [Muribaculaceae bacterium]
MNNLTFTAVIPARYASTRFPGKPLAQIGGHSMVSRVYRQVKKAVDDVWVATDDNRIYDECLRTGAKVVMTSPDHQSGT